MEVSPEALPMAIVIHLTHLNLNDGQQTAP
jgi:hypothetical protein